MSGKKYTTTVEIISDPLNFAYDRLPNLKEILTVASAQTITYTTLGRSLNYFTHPASKDFARDIAKSPGVVMNTLNNNTVAQSGINYGEGSIYATISKIIVKCSIIGSHLMVYGSEGIEKTSRSANYPGDTISRFFKIVEREKQLYEEDTNTFEKPFIDFVKNETKVSWIVESALETYAKFKIVDSLGSQFYDTGYTAFIEHTTCIIDNHIASAFGGSHIFAVNDDIYARTYKSFAMFPKDLTFSTITRDFKMMLRPVTVFALTTIVDLTGKFANELITAFGLGTMARICQDFTGIATREIYNFAQTQFDNLKQSIMEDVDNEDALLFLYGPEDSHFVSITELPATFTDEL